MTAFNAVASGKATVYCVHDRVKRQVTTEAQVAELGTHAGFKYDPKQHRIWLCACCQNLFVDPTDTPRFCRNCYRTPTHPLGGPLPTPNERPLT
jgi:hypothetical protein